MNKNLAIDFSFLSKLGDYKSVFTPILFIGIVFLTVVVSFMIERLVAGSSTILFIILIAVFMICYSKEAKRIEKYKLVVFTEFSKQNNLTFSRNVETSSSPGTLFGFGHTKKGAWGVSGSLNDLPFCLFEYSYIIGHGKYQRDYDFEVMEITLPRVMPNLVIDSLVESDGFGGSALPIEFSKSQKIELEGDFNKYFNIYAPDGYNISALSILGPDTMQTLIDVATKCDLEIINNKLYFYWPYPARNREQFEEYFQTTIAIIEETKNKLTKSDIYKTSSQEAIHANPVEGSGVKLKKRSYVPFITIGILIYISFNVITLLPGISSQGLIGPVLSPILFVAVIIMIVVGVLKVVGSFLQSKAKK